MSQSLSKVYVHATFSTKNREPSLDEAWRDELFSVVGGALNNLDCQSICVGGCADHVHALFQLARTAAIADVLGTAKMASSSWVNGNQRPPRAFHWQAGYGAFSVSQSNVESVREYVRRQPEHHRRLTFQDEFRALLARHNIAWNEQHVWD